MNLHVISQAHQIINEQYLIIVIWNIVIFRNEIRRPRKTDKIPYGSHIGWNITEEVWKLPAKHPFDHGLLYNQDNMEDVFDFIFYNLGYAGKTKINNSIAISEPLCNPNYCRNCTPIFFNFS